MRRPVLKMRKVAALLVGSWVILGLTIALVPSYNPIIRSNRNWKSPQHAFFDKSPNHQGPLLVINQTFGGFDLDWSGQIIECSGGGYAIVGYTGSFGMGYWDVWLLRIDVKGDLVWNQTYDGYGDQQGQSIVECSDGGFAIAGFTEIGYNYDAWLIRTDANGDPLWNKTYGSYYDDQAWHIIEPSGGGFLLSGYTEGWGAGQKDAWLIRTDSSGNQLWHETYGGPLDEFGDCVIECRSGGFALAGATMSYGLGEQDIWLVRTDSTGVHLWNQTYGGPNHEAVSECIEVSTGGFAMAGQRESHSGGLIDGYLLRTNATGSLLWDMVIPDGSLWGICEPRSGGLVATGRKEQDLEILRTDDAGTVLWDLVYGGSGIDAGHSILESAPNEFIIAGRTTSYGNGGTDIWLLQIREQTPPIPGFPVFSIIVGILLSLGIGLIRKRKTRVILSSSD